MTEKEFKELQEFEEFKELGLFRAQPFLSVRFYSRRAVGLGGGGSLFCAFCASLRLLRISSSSQHVASCHSLRSWLSAMRVALGLQGKGLQVSFLV
jgi:hypothetical protein